MKNKLHKFRESLTEIVAIALTFLCLGILVQLLLGETMIGWDPVGNVKAGGNALIGVVTIILLYILFIRDKK